MRQYREMCEDALLSDGAYNIKTDAKYFGKINVTFSEGKQNGHSYMTVLTKEDIFSNPNAKRRLTEEVKKCFLYYFKKMRITDQSKILVVCLGNERMTADSLGAKVADKLIVTSHCFEEPGVRARYGNMCLLKCGVSGTTGIESYDLIYGTVKQVKPDMVIAVDTLACSSLQRLGRTVQFSDGGIEPGGGVGNAKKALTFDTLKIPVLAVGVPFVIYATRILADYALGKVRTDENIEGLVVSAREIDFVSADYADVIAEALNTIVHERLFL